MTRSTTSAGLLSRKAASALLGGALVVTVCAPAWGGPTGERVTSGSASFSRDGSHTTITASNNAIINYQSFNIGANESVRFIQPSEMARVLNRVNSPDPSVIAGSLTANGQVFIVNQAGIYFHQGAVVDVGQLYASAGRISDADFLAGKNHFTNLTGDVINAGHIQAGAVHLLGSRVANMGSIVADSGVVTMVSGGDVLIGERFGHVFAKINGGGQGVSNTGSIEAVGGQVVLAAGDVYSVAIHNAGSVRADSITAQGHGAGIVEIGGVLDASSDDGIGGTVHVLGEKVGLFDALVDASGVHGGGEVLCTVW